MLCPHCGGYVKNELDVCPACGKTIEKPSAEELLAREEALQKQQKTTALPMLSLALMGGGALLMIISVFLPFFKISGYDVSINYLGKVSDGYSRFNAGTGDGVFFLILAIIFLILMAVHHFVKPMPKVLLIFAGVMGFFGLLFPLISRSDGSSMMGLISTGIGFYLIIISAIMLLAGSGLVLYKKSKSFLG